MAGEQISIHKELFKT